MIKRMVLLSRSIAFSRDAFFAHWAGVHASLAIQLPGVVKYTQNRVLDRLWRAPPTFLQYPVDGVVELYFASHEVMTVAATSSIGKELLPDDERRFLQAITLFNVEPDGDEDHKGGAKVIVVGKAGREVLVDLPAIRALPGVVAVGSNVPTRVYGREALPTEPDPPDILVTVWFEDEVRARAAFAPDGIFPDQLMKWFGRASAFFVEVHRVIAPPQ